MQRTARRTLARTELQASHERFTAVSPSVGILDAAALSRALGEDADAGLALLADLAVATDPALRAQARRLAATLLPRLGALGAPRRRGSRRLAVDVGTLEGDLDLERTLDRSGARRPRAADELVTRRLAAAPQTVCLLVDRSGSMSGHAVALAALAAAATVSAAGDRLRCAVVAFASQTLVLRTPADRGPADRVVEDLLSLRGHGATDIAAGLRTAAGLLADVAPGGRAAILLSDCRHTLGTDPLCAAGALDRLHVLCTGGEEDAWAAGAALARTGRGRLYPATSVGELTRSLALALR